MGCDSPSAEVRQGCHGGQWRWSDQERERGLEEAAGASHHHQPLPAQARVPAPLHGQHGEPHRLGEEPHGACRVRELILSLTNVKVDIWNHLRSASLSGTPSKYSFAAHMGSLMRGVEGQGCHNLYPECPFSNQDVTQIAKRINFKWSC